MLAVLSQLFLNCSQLSVHCSQHVPSAPQAGSQLFSNSLNYFSTVPPNVSQLRHPQFGIPLFSTLCQMSSVLYWLFPTISQLCLNCFSQFLNLFPTVCQMAYRLFWTLSQISLNYIIKCLPTLFQPCLNSLNYVANCVSAVLQPCPQMFPRYQLLVLITVSQLLLSFKLWPSATCFEAAMNAEAKALTARSLTWPSANGRAARASAGNAGSDFGSMAHCAACCQSFVCLPCPPSPSPAN